MRTLLIFAVIVFGINTWASAEDFVVELECVVFDRELTEGEKAAIQERMKEIPRESKGRFYSSQRLQALRQNARQLISSRATLIVRQSESSSHTFVNENLKTEAHFSISDVNEGECKIDVQCAMAYRRDAKSVTSASITSKFDVPLNTELTLGGGSANSHYALFVVEVREAQPEDRQPKKLSENFGFDFHLPVAQ